MDSILERLGGARRFADPGASLDARLMAARGALPLPPALLAQVLFALTLDPDPAVKELAAQSLAGLPDRVLDTVLGADVHPGLLAFFAERFRDHEARLEKIALNPAASDATLCFLAGLPYSRIVDVVAENQIRLLRCPALLDALGQNPLTGAATIDRILEFLGLHGRAPGAADAPPAEAGAAALGDPSDLPPQLVEEHPDQSPEQTEECARNLYALVQDMNVMEKIKLARFGNAEARSLLVRDRNRIVATAVVRSPKISESEISSIAKSRNISEEVLRVLANAREWTRSYTVQLALAGNPKTPLASAIKFLNYLTDRDLRQLMRSRDVPSPVSQQARRILARKGKV